MRLGIGFLFLALSHSAWANIAGIYSGEHASIRLAPVPPPTESPDLEEFNQYIKKVTVPTKFLSMGASHLKVIGIYPDHFETMATVWKWAFKDSNHRPIWDGNVAKKQRSNHASPTRHVLRPLLYEMLAEDGTPFLALVVEPSLEAVQHYSKIHLQKKLNEGLQQLQIEPVYHQGSDRAFVRFVLRSSGLLERFEQIAKDAGKGLILFLGYGSTARSALSDLRPLEENTDLSPFFKFSVSQNLNQTPIVTLEVGFNYRGKIGEVLLEEIGSARSVVGVIVGNRALPYQSFPKAVIPSEYSILSPEGILPGESFAPIPIIPSGLSVHFSASSTLLTPQQRDYQKLRGLTSFSTEGGFLARGARKAKLPFSSIFFFDPANAVPILRKVFSDIDSFDFAQSNLVSPRVRLNSVERFSHPLLDPEKHSLGKNLLNYCQPKGPPQDLFLGRKVIVAGVSPERFDHFLQKQRWKVIGGLRWNGSARVAEQYAKCFEGSKFGNTERPVLWEIEIESDSESDYKSGDISGDRSGLVPERAFLLQTYPGRETVWHWATLIRQYYPQVESIFEPGSTEEFISSRIKTSGLLQKLNSHPEWKSGEGILLFGTTEAAAQLLASQGYRSPDAGEKEFQFVTLESGFSYCLLTLAHHRPVFILNVDFPYWGELAGEIARQLLRDGNLFGVLSLAKVGQLAGPEYLEETYIPSQYSILGVDGTLEVLPKPEPVFGNSVRTGNHLSLPSPLMEELDLMQEMKLQNGIVTTDVEGAHLCKAAQEAKVRFSGLYYSSDYVPVTPKERDLKLRVQLHRTDVKTFEHKNSRLVKLVLHYLVPELRIR